MATYVDELARVLGGVALPKAKTFELKNTKGKGLFLGRRGGYLYAAAAMSTGNQNAVVLLVRHAKVAEPGMVAAALQAMPSFKKFVTKKQLLATGDSFIAFSHYSLRKPKPAEVGDFLDASADALRTLAPPLPEKCEDCGASTSEITLLNGVPGYHCSGCQQRLILQKEEEARQYAEKPLKLARGAVFGLGAAVLAGVVMGMLLYWMREGIPVKLWLILSLVLGAGTSFVLAWGSEKVDFWKQAGVAAALPVLANALADNLLLSQLLANEFQLPVTLLLFLVALPDLPHFLWQLDYGVLAILAQFGSAGMALGTLYNLRPKFAPTFTSVGALTETAQAHAAGD